MKQHVLLINEGDLRKAIVALEQQSIYYKIAGYPDGKVEVKESYPSKINNHSLMVKFAKSLGYGNVTMAIIGMGGGGNFKRAFDHAMENNKIN